MQLWAIADIHLSFKSNREEWAKLQHKEDDGLILAGDGMFTCSVDSQWCLTRKQWANRWTI